MADRYQYGNRNFGRFDRDRDWSGESDWDQNYFDNLRDVNMEDFGHQRNWSSPYNGDWDEDRLQDRGFNYYNSSSLGRSNLDRTPSGRRSSFGSRYDDYYYPGMEMRGYAYDYRYGKGIDNWRDTNLEDFGREDDENYAYGRGFDYDWEGEEYAPTFRYRETWDIPGPYTGRGPQGYHRSDDRIREDVCERLTQHGNVDPTGIDIEVHDGEVTLTGTVDRKRDKHIAEDVAYSVTGVEDVNNRIKVDPNDGVRVRGMGAENVVMPGRIKEGMEVYGRNGAYIGRVKFARNNDFLVDRPMARDIFVPFSAVRRTNGDILLRVAANEISDQDWEHPELFGHTGRPRDWRQPK